MKKNWVKFVYVFIFMFLAKFTMSQNWETKLDVFSSYVWRGTKYGSGPAFQPTIEYSKGSFTIGAWGNYCSSTDQAAEADVFIEFEFQLGEKNALLLTLNDYYYPGSSWFKFDSHYPEPALDVKFGRFSFLAAHMMNGKAGDIYLETNLDAGPVTLFAGAGEGYLTQNGTFGVCNLGLTTQKEIRVTDLFSLPVSGSIILNPSSEQFHIVVGISL